MNYQKLHDDIISNAQKQHRIRSDMYYENHHIIPKCLGGVNDKINRVLLTPKEHYIIHKLLTYIHSKNRKITCAFHYMSCNGKYKISSRDYEYARKLLSETPISKETREKLSISGKGKNKGQIPWNKGKTGVYSKENIENLRVIGKLRYSGKNNPMYGKRQSKYSINKMKKSKSGNNNPSFGSCWIYNINLKQTKKIHKSDIHEYEDWDLGRKMKFD